MIINSVQLEEARRASEQLDYLREQAAALPGLERKQAAEQKVIEAREQLEVSSGKFDAALPAIKASLKKRDDLIAELLVWFADITGQIKSLEPVLDQLYEQARTVAYHRMTIHNQWTGDSRVDNDLLRRQTEQILKDANLWPLGKYTTQNPSPVQNVLLAALRQVTGLDIE